MLKIGRLTLTRTVHFLFVMAVLNHLALLAGAILSPWSLLISIPWGVLAGALGISIGYHRLLCHRAFIAHPVTERTLTFLGALYLGGAPLTWVGMHRYHHDHADRTEDPHSPHHLGFWRVYLMRWRAVKLPRDSVRDLLDDPFQRWLYRNYVWFIGGIYISVYLLSPWAGIFLLSAPAVFVYHGMVMVNSVGHRYGSRAFETGEASRNNLFVSLFAAGEGWHNNHHRFPGLYRFGWRKGEYDLSAWLIENLRLSRNHEENREELRRAVNERGKE